MVRIPWSWLLWSRPLRRPSPSGDAGSYTRARVSQETLGETRESLYILQSLLRGERPQTRHSPSHSDLECEDGLSQYNGSGEILSALDSLDDMVTVLQFDAGEVPAWRDSLEVILRSVTPSCPPSLCEVARLHL